MRALLLCSLLALVACGRDVCADVDGTCVALAVHGTGQVDGLDITLSGAATGRQIAPEFAEVADLPVSVALAIDHPSIGPLHVALAAVRGGAVIGAGSADVTISPGGHYAATLELDASAVDGGLTSQFDLACPDMGSRCGSLCCGADQICSEGACLYPKAKAVVYLCPDFDNGCTASDFVIDGTCGPIQSPKPGKCYTTSLDVEAGKTYGISVCTGCNSGCSTSSSFMTPAGAFSDKTFYTGVLFYCKTPCTAPTTCPDP